MKMDAKSWLIVVLLIAAIVFGGLWYFKADNASEQRVKDLEQQVKDIEKEKKHVDLVIDSLQTKQKDLEKVIADKTAQLVIIEKENARLSSQVTSAKQNLDVLRKKLKETQDKITELTTNPIKRDGDDLLNSLKN